MSFLFLLWNSKGFFVNKVSLWIKILISLFEIENAESKDIIQVVYIPRKKNEQYQLTIMDYQILSSVMINWFWGYLIAFWQ